MAPGRLGIRNQSHESSADQTTLTLSGWSPSIATIAGRFRGRSGTFRGYSGGVCGLFRGERNVSGGDQIRFVLERAWTLARTIPPGTYPPRPRRRYPPSAYTTPACPSPQVPTLDDGHHAGHGHHPRRSPPPANPANMEPWPANIEPWPANTGMGVAKSLATPRPPMGARQISP